MSSFGRPLNVSQYIATLNSLDPTEPIALGEDEDLALFSNTEFFDFDMGKSLDVSVSKNKNNINNINNVNNVNNVNNIVSNNINDPWATINPRLMSQYPSTDSIPQKKENINISNTSNNLSKNDIFTYQDGSFMNNFTFGANYDFPSFAEITQSYTANNINKKITNNNNINNNNDNNNNNYNIPSPSSSASPSLSLAAAIPPAAAASTLNYPTNGSPANQRKRKASPNAISSDSFSILPSEDAARIAAEEDKRRRNTAASARFRIKKKLREQALERTTKDLKEKVEQLETRILQLQMENKWLKNLVVEKTGARESSDLFEIKASIYGVDSVSSDKSASSASSASSAPSNSSTKDNTETVSS